MRLNIVRSTNSTQFYVIKSVRENGVSTTKIVEKLGNLEQVMKKAGDQDPETWARAYVAELNRLEKEGREPKVIAEYDPQMPIETGIQTRYAGGYLFLQKIYHQLGLHKICKEICGKYQFKYDLNNILSRLVYGRVLSPSSKLGTMDYSKTLIEQPNFELHQIYRALEVLAKENDFIQSELYKNSLKFSKRNDRILYYDCTNYYFEIEEEDDFRKYGHSKENRPNPIVQMGLFLDGDGIPLAFSITPGNTNEQTTLKPLEKKIVKDFMKASFVVCTDAGLSSTTNRKFNDITGRGFVTTQSVKMMKDYQKEWALADDGWMLPGSKMTYKLSKVLADENAIERYMDKTFYKERWINEDGIEQRFIVTFSLKYMLYQRQLRQKQLQRAEKIIKTNTAKRPRQNDPKRFIKETAATAEGEVAEKKIFTIDEEEVNKEATYDGFYAVATNLEDDAESIVKINTGRWEIEESFRIMKNEFSARPVYLSREDRITAHFTTCFIALTLYRYLEKKLGDDFTCSEILSTLRGMDFQHLEGNGYIPLYTRTSLTDSLHESFGFRTDYQIVTNRMMKKILSSTKK